jgi:hypothetical protein
MLVLPCKICGGFVKPILEVFSCPVSHSNSSIHRQPKMVWKLKTEYEQKTDLLCMWMKLSSQKQTLINPLKPKLVYILFKNPVRTSKRTPHFTITKINWLTLFKFNPLKTKLV